MSDTPTPAQPSPNFQILPPELKSAINTLIDRAGRSPHTDSTAGAIVRLAASILEQDIRRTSSFHLEVASQAATRGEPFILGIESRGGDKGGMEVVLRLRNDDRAETVVSGGQLP